jgi:hypothetical protein
LHRFEAHLILARDLIDWLGRHVPFIAGPRLTRAIVEGIRWRWDRRYGRPKERAGIPLDYSSPIAHRDTCE